MNDIPIYASTIIGSFMVKYEQLSYLIDKQYGNSSADKINLYIDLYSIVNRLYRTRNLKFDSNSTIAGNILSLCNHYINFFRKRYNVETNVLIIASNNMPANNIAALLDYNKGYRESVRNNIILTEKLNESIVILNEVCLFIKNIMLISSSEETGVVLKDVIQYAHDHEYPYPNLIITKDMYNYQLVDDNTCILRPFKKQADISYIITKDSVMRCTIGKLVTNDNLEQTYSNIPHNLLSAIFAFTRFPARNIPSLIPLGSFLNQLSKLIDLESYRDKRIFNTNIQSIYSTIMNNTNLVNNIPLALVESRFNVIDIGRQYDIYINSPTGIMQRYNGMKAFFGESAIFRKLLDDYFTIEEANMIVNLNS